MGTRSAIGYKTEKGIRAVYCHYDGYVVGAGRILQENYQAAYKIARLIEQGDMSYMAPEPMPTAGSGHSFETPEEGVVIYYGRDRGETGVETKEFETVAEFVDYFDGCGCEYFYLFNGKEWIVNDHYRKDANDYPMFDRVEDKMILEVANLKARGYDINFNSVAQ
jgi:hypothetical protein